LHPLGGDWLFLHYEQLMRGTAFGAIEQLLGARVRRDFADPALRRSTAHEAVPPNIQSLYHRLCALAGFAPDE
jgi:hypothetical protein